MSAAASWFRGVPVLVAVMALIPWPAGGQGLSPVAIAVGEPGDPSYRIGQDLAGRLRQHTAEAGEVELWESLNADERILVLLDDVQLAVVPEDQPVPARARDAVAFVVDAAPGYQVLVRADLDPRVVDAIGGPGATLATAAVAIPTARPSEAPAPARQTLPSTSLATAGKSFTIYFDFDKAELSREQMGAVAAACQYASTLPSASFVLAGHTDTLGPDIYNQSLAQSRADAVAAAIRNDERFRDALNVLEFGEQQLAVPTGDEVWEPKNRRVVITVVSGETPMPAAGPESSAQASQ
ncbi:MAG: OmpA family protein [Pseudomonadota bacterium]